MTRMVVPGTATGAGDTAGYHPVARQGDLQMPRPGDGQAAATAWAAVAQVHATLALSAATTLNHEIRRRERGAAAVRRRGRVTSPTAVSLATPGPG